jgi:hypothetical protein
MLRVGIKDFMMYDYIAPPLPVNMLAKYHLNPDGTPLNNKGSLSNNHIRGSYNNKVSSSSLSSSSSNSISKVSSSSLSSRSSSNSISKVSSSSLSSSSSSNSISKVSSSIHIDDNKGLLMNSTDVSHNDAKKKKKNLRHDIGSFFGLSSGSSSSKSDTDKDRRQLVNSYVNTHHYKSIGKEESRPTAASFSLRSVKTMLSIIREYGHSHSDSEPEAIFFLRSAVKMNVKVAPRAIAYNFAVQYECIDINLNQEPPLAIHHAWRYYNHEKVY